MSYPSTRVLTAAQLRTLESSWISACHEHWGLVLMDRAAAACTRVALNMLDQAPGKVTVVCGRGNNGGDGLAVAGHLSRHGVPVRVFMMAPERDAAGSAGPLESLVNQRIIEQHGFAIQWLSAGPTTELDQSLSESALVIDALLGTGLRKDVEGVYHTTIESLNACRRPILSIDIPSGINSDSGQVMGAAVVAYETVTFGYLKPGLLCYPGAQFAGRIHLADIGLPPVDRLSGPLASLRAELSQPHLQLTTFADVAQMLPLRAADSHKGSYGRLLTIAGSAGMAGSAVMAAMTALKTGVGLSILATPASLVPNLPPSEVIFKPLEETSSLTISAGAAKSLETEIAQAQAVLLGPGLSSNIETIKFVQELVADLKKPCIVDADGLNAISQNRKLKLANPGGFVFTPHPKELSRLLGVSTQDIQADRFSFALKAANSFGCAVVLKGAHSVVASSEGELLVIPRGNSGMATAGSGDVLSGVIGALLAQGLQPFLAAVVGTYIHGAAGDLAAQSIGPDGTVAGDIMANVPVVLKELRNGSFAGNELEWAALRPI